MLNNILYGEPRLILSNYDTFPQVQDDRARFTGFNRSSRRFDHGWRVPIRCAGERPDFLSPEFHSSDTE